MQLNLGGLKAGPTLDENRVVALGRGHPARDLKATCLHWSHGRDIGIVCLPGGKAIAAPRVRRRVGFHLRHSARVPQLVATRLIVFFAAHC